MSVIEQARSRTRRARGEVPALIMQRVESDPCVRYTPYMLAVGLGLNPASATAACKRLVEQGRLRVYGESPLVVGSLRA